MQKTRSAAPARYAKSCSHSHAATIRASVHDDVGGTMDIEYEAGDIIPVTSSLYRVLHDPPKEGQRFETFYAGESFPPCPDCGKNVRYVLPRSILVRVISG